MNIDTPVLALYDPFGVDVPLNLDIPPPPPMNIDGGLRLSIGHVECFEQS